MMASPEAEEAWTEHVNELAVGTLLSEADSWFFGANIPGKKRTVLMYLGGALAYRKKVDEVAAKGYEGFVLE
jgi:cyclohexanone monooxygenase